MGSQGMPGYPGPQGLVVCKYITSSRIDMKKKPVNIYFCLTGNSLQFDFQVNEFCSLQGPAGRNGRRGRRGARGKPVGRLQQDVGRTIQTLPIGRVL